MRASAIAHHSPFRWVRCPGAVVGARGFEPPTSCSQSRCATRLRHAPEPQARDISARASGCSRSELLRATDAPSRLSGAAVMAAGDLPVDDFALQQLEDAAEQIAAVKRRGDEVVAQAVRMASPLHDIAGKQRLEPRLARPDLAQCGRAIEGSGQVHRRDRQREGAVRRGTDCREPLRDGGDRKSLFGQDALDQLAPPCIVVDDEDLLPFRVHVLLASSNPLASKRYDAKPLVVSLTAKMFRCGYHQSLAGFLDLSDEFSG